MQLMVEKGIRGLKCLTIHAYAKANNIWKVTRKVQNHHILRIDNVKKHFCRWF